MSNRSHEAPALTDHIRGRLSSCRARNLTAGGGEDEREGEERNKPGVKKGDNRKEKERKGRGGGGVAEEGRPGELPSCTSLLRFHPQTRLISCGAWLRQGQRRRSVQSCLATCSIALLTLENDPFYFSPPHLYSLF